MSVIQIKPKRDTATHSLDGISWPMSAIQMKPRRHRAPHLLDEISWQHVSHSNGAQEAHSSSQTGWDFMAACQPFKWSPRGTPQLTLWMEFHGSISARKWSPRGTQQLTPWIGFIAACQPFKWSPGGTQQLTVCMGFHNSMTAIQMEPKRHTVTHSLDGISLQHVSKSNGAQEAHSNSQTGWNFMAACQPDKLSPGDTQELTNWMAFHSSTSASQIEPRRHTATHFLDSISWQHVSHSD